MTDIQLYPTAVTGQLTTAPAAEPGTAMQRAADFTTWAPKLQAAAAIAAEIAATEFVPQALRGRAPAVAAAILAGSEMNLGPMASLMHVHIIEGRPALSAEMARSLVYSMGHQIRWVESNTQRCVIEGLRRGEREWFRVQYTMDDAKRAGLDGRPNWRRHPRRMLAARASGELCRLHFADCMAGMPYVAEELEDGGTDDAELPPQAGAAPPAEAAPRTAQRKTTTRRTSASRTSAPVRGGPGAASAAAAPATPGAGPPLPGEAGYDEPAAEEPQRGDETSPPASDAQVRLMHRLFKEADVTDRAERLKLTGLLLEQQLDTSKGLTVADATAIIDALSALKASGHEQGLAGAVNDVLNLAALKEADEEPVEQESATDPGADS